MVILAQPMVIPVVCLAVSVKDPTYFVQRVLPLLEEYCYDCHGDGSQKGDFAIDELIELGNYSDHSKRWERVWQNIYNRNMPPINAPQPLTMKFHGFYHGLKEHLLGTTHSAVRARACGLEAT